MNIKHLSLLACALLLPGCATAFTQTEHVTLDAGFEATQAAMNDLQYTVRDKAKEESHATVTAAGPGKPDVRVRMDVRSDHITEFRIKVGMLRDTEQAQKIMDTIRAHF